jgi:hypothetical protein
MVRLRDSSGKVKPLPDNVVFVEICDVEGNLHCVILINNKHHIEVLKEGDSKFEMYAEKFKLNKTREILLT